MSYNPTQYRISTITATGSVHSDVDLDVILNLDVLYSSFRNIILESGVGKTPEIRVGAVYAKFGENESETYYKEFSKKFSAQKKKENTTKRFDNQLTVIYKYNEESLMNIKMFKNGNIQITGIKDINDGKKMIDILIEIMRDICKKEPTAVQNVEKLQNSNYKVALINSDFKIGFEIKRDKLYTVLINNYDNKCSFEPCIYPGVKIQYFWNKKNMHNDGVCHCKAHCATGKNDGSGEGKCKKITIAVFQSGCIIITGAQTTEQIDEAYEYICDVLKTHFEFVKKISLSELLPQLPKVEKVKVMLKKSTIIYPNSMMNTNTNV
jgi:TATA-box binding protein (TBP) (component of TFIID and TFIIIB)